LKVEVRLNNVYLKTSSLHHTNLSQHYKEGQVMIYTIYYPNILTMWPKRAGRLDVKATDACNFQLALSR